MCKNIAEEIIDYKRFEHFYWAMKKHESDPLKYAHPSKIFSPHVWKQWSSDGNLRSYIISKIEYDCFWRKQDREMLYRTINDSYWIIRHDDNFDDTDLFDLNYLFFEADGDIWKTCDEDVEDLFDLNYLFRNFSIRPKYCDPCCEEEYGSFGSDYDVCESCYCCRYLLDFLDL